jgi:hypothetical protein
MTEIRRNQTLGEDDTSPLLDESTIPIEDDEESETRYFQPQGTVLSSVINITNTILGSGMLAMVLLIHFSLQRLQQLDCLWGLCSLVCVD